MTQSCASIPTGPSVLVLPGTGLSLDQFNRDNIICQQFAKQQIGGTQSQIEINSDHSNSANSRSSMYEDQFHYDIAYIQCMYAKGHQVPVYGQLTGVTPAQATSPYPPVPPFAPKPIATPPPLNQNELMPPPTEQFHQKK